MSNHIVSVSATPDSIKSGAATQLVVNYESDDGGAIQLSSGGGFDISPAAKTVAASPAGQTKIKVTITRTNATTENCLLVVKFFSTSREVFVEIT